MTFRLIYGDEGQNPLHGETFRATQHDTMLASKYFRASDIYFAILEKGSAIEYSLYNCEPVIVQDITERVRE